MNKEKIRKRKINKSNLINIRWILTFFVILSWLTIIILVIFYDFPLGKKGNEPNTLFGILIATIIVLLITWLPFKKSDKPTIAELTALSSIIKKSQKVYHLRYKNGYHCCGDLDLICKECGHQGLNIISPAKKISAWRDFRCPECKREGIVSTTELNRKWKKI